MGRIPDENLPDRPIISHLWPHHRSMARAVVEGVRNKELAVMYGMTEGQISRIVNSPMFKLEVERLESYAEEVSIDTKKEIARMSIRALEILDEQMHKKEVSEQIRQNAAFDILNRAGYSKKDRPIHVEGDMINIQHNEIRPEDMTEEQLRDDVLDLLEDGDGNFSAKTGRN